MRQNGTWLHSFASARPVWIRPEPPQSTGYRWPMVMQHKGGSVMVRGRLGVCGANECNIMRQGNFHTKTILCFWRNASWCFSPLNSLELPLKKQLVSTVFGLVYHLQKELLQATYCKRVVLLWFDAAGWPVYVGWCPGLGGGHVLQTLFPKPSDGGGGRHTHSLSALLLIAVD